MDIDLLRDGEHFSTFDSTNFLDQYPDEMTHLDDIDNFSQNQYEWSLDSEREINGDIALIPVLDTNLTKFNDLPPNIDDFQKIVNDWLNVDPCTEFTIEQPEHNIDQKIEPLDPINATDFDLTTYLNELDPPQTCVSPRKHKAGVKKIDLQAQKYIIDEEDDVDVETISESEENSPVLEAKDLNSLLEQFEASQIPANFIQTDINESIYDQLEESSEDKSVGMKSEPLQDESMGLDVKLEPTVTVGERNSEEMLDIHQDLEKSQTKQENIVPANEKTVNPPLIKKDLTFPQPSSTKLPTPKTNSITIPKASPTHTIIPKLAQTLNNSMPNPESTTSTPPNKQIIDSLPQELIARIKESGKRKTISVIPPIPPTKKRGGPRMQEAAAQLNRNKMIKLIGAETVQLDHDYCSSPTSAVEPYPKNPKKDSGFESAEEDDRTVIGKQPTVKNADGKLMVSLLKVNTIHANITTQKKKLNLEEYKKRREGFLKSQNSSQNSSPISSTCSSPLPEDENTKLLKHQEKLMRMAKEVLNTPPKGEKKTDTAPMITPPVPVTVPADMVMKTLVSIGVNTDFKVRSKNLDPLAPVERLDEIKPLLQKASAKINENSLITSVIENIPKIIDSCDAEHSKIDSEKDKNSNNNDENKNEHGEDKTIVYLPKNRKPPPTRTIECQTNISLIQQTKAARYRRRRQSSDSSSSSVSSGDSRKSRSTSRYNRDKSSNNSRCSSRGSKSSKSSKSSTYSSRSSSRSRSRSRSRSASPRQCRREKERLREVEERRVIYVGRIPPGTNRDDLRKRFQRFGPITNVSMHSRDHSYLDNYGFVTFANKLDAYEAIEHGNDDPWQPKFDLSFGGRRIFCQTNYSDLDNMRDESGYYVSRSGTEDSFDKLLREVQEKLRKRKA